MLYKLTTFIKPSDPNGLSFITLAVTHLSKTASAVFYDDSQRHYEIYFLGDAPPSNEELVKNGVSGYTFKSELSSPCTDSHSLISSQLLMSQQNQILTTRFYNLVDAYNKNSHAVSLLFQNLAESKGEISSPIQPLNSNSPYATTAQTQLLQLINFHLNSNRMRLAEDSNVDSAMSAETNLQSVTKYHLDAFLRDIHSQSLTPTDMNHLLCLLIHNNKIVSARSQLPPEDQGEFVHISLNFAPDKQILTAPDNHDNILKAGDIVKRTIQNILFDEMYCPQIDLRLGKKNPVIEVYLHFVVLNFEKERFKRQINETLWATGLCNELSYVMITHVERPCLLNNINSAPLHLPTLERQLTIFQPPSSQPVLAQVVQAATDTVMLNRRPSQG